MKILLIFLELINKDKILNYQKKKVKIILKLFINYLKLHFE